MLILALFVLTFIGGEAVSAFLSSSILSLQFVPAAMRAFAQPALKYIAAPVLIIVLTIFFGRVYCSFLCPLGAMQDIFAAVGRKKRGRFYFSGRILRRLAGPSGRRRHYAYRKPLNWLRYGMLAVVAAATAAGIMILLILFDPYSIAGRFVSHFVEPLFVWAANAGISLLVFAGIRFFTLEQTHIPLAAFAVSTIFFVFIAGMAWKYGRLYCNTVCPVGALLGILSRISVFRPAIDNEVCNQCGLCSRVCKSGCIDAKAGVIDESRCVVCFECIAECPKKAVKFKKAWEGAKHEEEWSLARRGFMLAAAAGVGSLLLAAPAGMRTFFRSAPAEASQKFPVTAPGSLGLDHFRRSCTACHLCVSACPTKVLSPSLWTAGTPVFMQPVMDYEKGHCEYECNLCGRACPTGAIQPLALEDKKLAAIGEAKLLEEKCVVYRFKKNCGACGEVCPTHAISFKDRQGVLYPEVEKKYCIGCGACELACPTEPKSIVVKANAVHKKAEKYAEKAGEKSWEKKEDTGNEDFPF